jgi:hypothetical protein
MWSESYRAATQTDSSERALTSALPRLSHVHRLRARFPLTTPIHVLEYVDYFLWPSGAASVKWANSWSGGSVVGWVKVLNWTPVSFTSQGRRDPEGWFQNEYQGTCLPGI